MKNPFKLFFLFLFIITSACAPAATPTPKPSTSEVRDDLAKYFDSHSVEGAFVLYDLNADHTTRYNPQRCAKQFLPASTYKIINALIALESGVASDADYEIKWDGMLYPIPEWNHDQTLRSAMQNSVVWYYRELSLREGNETIQKYIDAIDYGNRDIGGGDTFWLTGNLRISADEQIALLTRLYKNDLPFSQRNMDIVKDILVREKTEDHILRAKTGLTVKDNITIGWYIGYIEKDADVYFFATNISSASPDEKFSDARIDITFDILKELNIIEVIEE